MKVALTGEDVPVLVAEPDVPIVAGVDEAVVEEATE